MSSMLAMSKISFNMANMVKKSTPFVARADFVSPSSSFQINHVYRGISTRNSLHHLHCYSRSFQHSSLIPSRQKCDQISSISCVRRYGSISSNQWTTIQSSKNAIHHWKNRITNKSIQLHNFTSFRMLNMLESNFSRPFNFNFVHTRHMSVYGFGAQWTGALGRGTDRLFLEEAPELSPEELYHMQQMNFQPYHPYSDQTNQNLEEGDETAMDQYNTFQGQNMVQFQGVENYKCVGASAGWGHTALLLQHKQSQNKDQINSANKNDNSSPKLFLCGRPHEFQTLLRLRRIPKPLRNFSLRHTLPSKEAADDISNSEEDGAKEQSFFQMAATFFVGEEATTHEEEHREYSNMPILKEMKLPDGEVPAIEGNVVPTDGMNGEAYLSEFQNTLAASAGFTALISSSGTLYTFGLNHRGQCGVGSFSPNVWIPSTLIGLGSTRYILDHGATNKDETSKDVSGGIAAEGKRWHFTKQENPIVSVALGLQHGIALDSAGQVFCWGKGERGQLGQGRRMASALKSTDSEESSDSKKNKKDEEEAQPNENRTFEYALHVEHFYDPFASLSDYPKDIYYAPQLSPSDARVKLVGAGMNFSVAVTHSNLPYIWGKNCIPNPEYDPSSLNLRTKPVKDATYPIYLPGLPEDLEVVRLACGSHHVSMLLEDGSVWAAGVATDSPDGSGGAKRGSGPIPMWDELVEILPPGIVDMEQLVSFTAGFDRTMVVCDVDDYLEDGDGGERRRQVVECQLWSLEELRMNGAVRPSWVDWLESKNEERIEENRSEKVRSVHRGWMHSVVVTEED